MTDIEFIKLINMSKKFSKDNIKLPKNGENNTFDVISLETKDSFFLDIDRGGKIELSKIKIQNRYARTRTPLIRIDIDSPPHTNPDGTKLGRNHIHIYRDIGEFDTGNLPWAYDLDEFDGFDYKIGDSFIDVFFKFCDYCNINAEDIQGVL